jgi:16S rRNA (uracil1498-N3)-methyltransferase
MNIPRFFIDSKLIEEAVPIIVLRDAKLVKQIRKVLRLDNGARIDILDGKGNIYHCRLQILDSKPNHESIQAKIESKESIANTPQTKVTIALPLIKINRFEWAIEKLTELGVDTIVPVALSRSMIKLSNDEQSAEAKSKFIRWQKIIQEAAEQCERPVPPKLSPSVLFENWLKNIENENSAQLKIICTERQNVQNLENLLYNQINLPSSCAIAFGAEGGFTEEEIKLALSHQFIPVSLGPLILRTETASIYTLAIVNAFLRLIQKDPQL